MRKIIYSVAFIMLALTASQKMQAQQLTLPILGNGPRQNINPNSSLLLGANSDASNHQEWIYFYIRGQQIGSLTNNSLSFRGRDAPGRPIGDRFNIASDRGFEFTANIDHNGPDGEKFVFNAGRAGINKVVRVLEFNDQNFRILRGNVGIGSSTLAPTQRLHVRSGNIQVDGGSYRSHGPVRLHPDTDDTGDDSVIMTNSANGVEFIFQDGQMTFNSGQGTIASGGTIVLRPDHDNNSDNDIVEFRDGGNQLHTSVYDNTLRFHKAGATILGGGGLVLRPELNSNGTNDYVSFRDASDVEKTRIQDGTITTDRVVLRVGTFPDYVFSDSYDLMPLEKVEAFIKKNKHLPNMPSEKEVVAKGMSVGQINTVLVEKVEELTLHTIDQEKKIDQLEKELATLKSAVQKLTSQK